jgi:hypothetical protein
MKNWRGSVGEGVTSKYERMDDKEHMCRTLYGEHK